MDIRKIFSIGKKYEISTKIREVPVKTNLTLKWIDEKSKLLGFSWDRCILRGAFLPKNDVYIKLGSEYAKGKVISSSSELVIESKEVVNEVPGYVRRRYVRVETDPSNPVYAYLKFENLTVRGFVKDISEAGVGTLLHRNEVEVQNLLELLHKSANKLVDITVELPKYGKVHAKGHVRNIVVGEEDVYVRVGFETEFTKEDREKVRKYVLERQQEIIKSIRML